MFYIATHSTHFMYGYMASDIMVKDHSDSERGNPLPPHGLLFPISSKGSFICIIPQTGEREREMFYLATHSTHFMYGYMESDIMVKDHSDSERGNPLLPHGLLFPISSKGSFICIIPQTGEREREMFYLTMDSTHFNLRLYGVRQMVKDHSDSEKGNPLPPHRPLLSINSKGSFICIIPQTGEREREREMFYLTTHSTHFIYGYMASDIWLRTILIVRKETRCRHICYSYRLTARVLLYASSHRQEREREKCFI